MADNTCICCGRIIPEGRQICLHCGDYDDMQTFRPPRRARITNGDRLRAMDNSNLVSAIARITRLDCFSGIALFNWLESEAKIP